MIFFQIKTFFLLIETNIIILCFTKLNFVFVLALLFYTLCRFCCFTHCGSLSMYRWKTVTVDVDGFEGERWGNVHYSGVWVKH